MAEKTMPRREFVLRLLKETECHMTGNGKTPLLSAQRTTHAIAMAKKLGLKHPAIAFETPNGSAENELFCAWMEEAITDNEPLTAIEIRLMLTKALAVAVIDTMQMAPGNLTLCKHQLDKLDDYLYAALGAECPECKLDGSGS